VLTSVFEFWDKRYAIEINSFISESTSLLRAYNVPNHTHTYVTSVDRERKKWILVRLNVHLEKKINKKKIVLSLAIWAALIATNCNTYTRERDEYTRETTTIINIGKGICPHVHNLLSHLYSRYGIDFHSHTPTKVAHVVNIKYACVYTRFDNFVSRNGTVFHLLLLLLLLPYSVRVRACVCMCVYLRVIIVQRNDVYLRIRSTVIAFVRYDNNKNNNNNNNNYNRNTDAQIMHWR
jgi:hypothetical protein